MHSNQVLETLSQLVKTSHEGQRQFGSAAAHARDEELQSTFSVAAARCGEGVRELQRLMARHGAIPSTNGCADAIMIPNNTCEPMGSDDLTLLEELERSEDTAEKLYLGALQQPLPNNVRAALQRLCHSVLENHDHVRALRDQRRQAQAAG